MFFFLGGGRGGGGSIHKTNTRYLLLGLHHASVNWMSIVLIQITPQNELYYGAGEKSKLSYILHKAIKG